MKLYLPVLCLCIMASCSKNNDVPGKDLSQFNITFFDSLTYQHKYQRDANNRVIAVEESTAKIGVLVVTRTEYNLNGTVKKVTFHQNDSAIVRDFLEFEYNAKGQYAKRFWRSGSTAVDESCNTYTYDADGRLLIDSQFNKVGGNYALIYYTNFQYTGNNITEAMTWEIKSGTPELRRRVKYEYDNKLNPFKAVSNEYFFLERASAAYDISILSENNIIKQYDAKGNDPYMLLATAAYEYNSNNFPTKLQSTHATNPKMNFHAEYFFR